MANILVIRLSAIGDVAMTVPVIYSAAKANPTDSFTVLTQAFLIPVFINRPKNVNDHDHPYAVPLERQTGVCRG